MQDDWVGEGLFVWPSWRGERWSLFSEKRDLERFQHKVRTPRGFVGYLECRYSQGNARLWKATHPNGSVGEFICVLASSF